MEHAEVLRYLRDMLQTGEDGYSVADCRAAIAEGDEPVTDAEVRDGLEVLRGEGKLRLVGKDRYRITKRYATAVREMRA